MDIDDILAEVDRESVPQETRDLQELTRAWVGERAAPELLPWPHSLMERMMDRIRRQVRGPSAERRGLAHGSKRLSADSRCAQIEVVETQTGNLDPKANFSLIVIQTELERFKYLVRSFLRARMAKVRSPHPLPPPCPPPPS